MGPGALHYILATLHGAHGDTGDRFIGGGWRISCSGCRLSSAASGRRSGKRTPPPAPTLRFRRDAARRQILARLLALVSFSYPAFRKLMMHFSTGPGRASCGGAGPQSSGGATLRGGRARAGDTCRAGCGSRGRGGAAGGVRRRDEPGARHARPVTRCFRRKLPLQKRVNAGLARVAWPLSVATPPSLSRPSW